MGMMARNREECAPGDRYPMKRVLILTIAAVVSTACLLTPAVPSGPVQTEVAYQLTALVTDTPTPMDLPPINTLVPPAVNLPAPVVSIQGAPESTATPNMTGPLPTVRVLPTKVPTYDPNSVPTQDTSAKPVVYSVTGTAGTVEIAIVKPDGDLEAGTYNLPFTKNYDFPAASYLSVTARILSANGTATCEIKQEERILSTNTVEGTNQMATCVIVLPE